MKRNEPDLHNNSDDRRLWKRLQQIKSLPERDQLAILRMLDNTIILCPSYPLCGAWARGYGWGEGVR
jgi:hypothetical protein